MEGSAELPDGTRHKIPLTAELKTSVKTPTEHVCGAEFSQHWGMSDADGSLNTSVLALQILQRLKQQKIGRSPLLSSLSGQIAQFHELELAFQEQLMQSQAAAARSQEELRAREGEAERIRHETRRIVAEHEKRLATACKGLCKELEVVRLQAHEDGNKLAACEHRRAEQQSMLQTFEEHNAALQESLDKTVRKFDDVASSYSSAREELRRSVVGDAPGPGLAGQPGASLELASALARVDGLVGEAGEAESELGSMCQRLGNLRDTLAGERQHAARLEAFVLKLATGPATSLRKGGGFMLDNTVKRDAQLLIQEMERAGECPGVSAA